MAAGENASLTTKQVSSSSSEIADGPHAPNKSTPKALKR